MSKTCYCCDGTGISTCRSCNGTGKSVRLAMEYIPIFHFALPLPSVCEICGGHGQTKCEVCKGTGVLKDEY